MVGIVGGVGDLPALSAQEWHGLGREVHEAARLVDMGEGLIGAGADRKEEQILGVLAVGVDKAVLQPCEAELAARLVGGDLGAAVARHDDEGIAVHPFVRLAGCVDRNDLAVVVEGETRQG